MPHLSDTHSFYDASIDAVKEVRDCIAGGRTVKREAYRYLPMLAKQEGPRYEAYKLRAKFFNATKRTLAAFVGFVFRKNPQFEYGKDVPKDFVRDCTMTGKSFYDYCKKVVREVMSVGRAGTLIDWDAPTRENRAYLIRYDTENIINWRYGRIAGKTMLIFLVLKECSNEVSDTELRTKYTGPETVDEKYTDERYRVYQLLMDGEGLPFVYCSIWQRTSKDSTELEKVDEFYPNRRGYNLGRIPFEFHNTEGSEADPIDIPLDDLAQINIHHYRQSADLENARHVCGVPTLFLTGVDDKAEFYLGSDRAIVADKGATADFIQADSQKLSGLTTGLDESKQEMAALGARMLEKQSASNQAEAFETVQIRQSGESSALMDITIACTETLSRVMRWIAWWNNPSIGQPEDLSETVFVELNTDYTSTDLDPTMLTALTAAYQTGGISYEEYFRKLQQGGIISSEKTIEQEREALKDSPNVLPDGTGLPAPGAAATAAAHAAAAAKAEAQGGGKAKQ